MTNYFFISSPLHFFIATNLAITFKGNHNIAIFMSKNEKTAKQYSKAAKHFTDIFQETFLLNVNDEHAKVSQRKHCFNQIEKIVALTPPNRIFTGSDRRVEFQFAMHIARKNNADVEGVYIDDGIISYLGHKSINNIFHRYIDPTLKKLIYGRWWKNALTIGSSSWITTAYLAAPNDAHSLLRTKKLNPLDQNIFTGEQFLAVNDFLVGEYEELIDIDFKQIKAVLCLPYESLYLKNIAFLSQIKNQISKELHAESIAIKAHPRSKNQAVLNDIFPNSTFLPNTLGMELLLPKLSNETSIFGDVSTALLTAKWLKPKITVQAFEVNDKTPAKLKQLFDSVGINFISLK